MESQNIGKAGFQMKNLQTSLKLTNLPFGFLMITPFTTIPGDSMTNSSKLLARAAGYLSFRWWNDRDLHHSALERY